MNNEHRQAVALAAPLTIAPTFFPQPPCGLGVAVDRFRARCEARALLYAAGELDLQEAVDLLQADAVASGLVDEIGQDAVQQVMADAFRGVRP